MGRPSGGRAGSWLGRATPAKPKMVYVEKIVRPPPEIRMVEKIVRHVEIRTETKHDLSYPHDALGREM